MSDSIYKKPVTLYELTQNEIRAFNKACALQYIPLDQPEPVGMHFIDDHYRSGKDGQWPLDCLEKALQKAVPESSLFRTPYALPQDAAKRGRTLLAAYYPLPKEKKERIREAYLDEFWEQSRKGDAFEYQLLGLCNRKLELCKEKMDNLGIDRNEPLYIMQSDWSFGDMMDMEAFTSNMLLDTSSCQQSRKLTYNPQEECLEYSVSRWNERYEMEENYEAKILPRGWACGILGRRSPETIETLACIYSAAIPGHRMKDGLADLDTSVRDWYRERNSDDERYLRIADISFRDAIDAFMEAPEAADALVCGDAHLRDSFLHELPARTGLPLETVLHSYESGIPLAGTYKTIRDVMEETTPDTSMRDWYQAVSRNPLAGINMKDQTFREFIDHFKEHPDGFFMEKNPDAFRAIRSMISRMTGFSDCDISHAWNDHLTIDQCAGFTQEGRDVSDEQAALLNDAFQKCHLEDWHAKRDAWYGGVVIQNRKDMRMLGDQFYREDLLEYLTTDPYFTKDPDFNEVIPVIRAAKAYREGDKDAYTELARDKDVHDRYEAIIDYPVKVYTQERDNAYLRAAFDAYKDLLLPENSSHPVRPEEVDTTTAFDVRIVRALRKEGIGREDILQSVRDNSPQYARAEDGSQYLKEVRRSIRKLDRSSGR